MENFKNNRLLWKSPVEALSGQKSRVCGPPWRDGGDTTEADRPSRGNLGEYARVAGLLLDEPELCRRDARRRGQEDERPRDCLIVQVRPRTF